MQFLAEIIDGMLYKHSNRNEMQFHSLSMPRRTTVPADNTVYQY
jgi:hypothetical protein